MVYMRPKSKEGWTCGPDRLDGAQEVDNLWQEVRQDGERRLTTVASSTGRRCEIF